MARAFGGAHAIWVAAFDERVKATVSAVGVHDGERWLKTLRRPYEWLAFQSRVREAARRRVTTNERETIIRHDIYSDDPDNPKPPMTLEEHGSEEVLELDLESVEACFRYRPEWVAGKNLAPARPVHLRGRRRHGSPVRGARLLRGLRRTQKDRHASQGTP